MTTRLTLDDVRRLATGRAVLKQFGKEVRYRLNSVEQGAFEAAQRQHYIVLTGHRPNLENVWWEWCRVLDQPFIRVRRRRQWASVELDVFTRTEDLHPHAVAEIEDVFKRLMQQGGARRYSAACPGSVLSWIDDVPWEEAEPLAESLWAIATNRDLSATEGKACVSRERRTSR